MAQSKPYPYSSKKETPVEAIPISFVVEYTIGKAFSAREAFIQIGDHWDNLPATGDTLNGHYQFVIDGQLFKVSVEPVVQELETPFGPTSDPA